LPGLHCHGLHAAQPTFESGNSRFEKRQRL